MYNIACKKNSFSNAISNEIAKFAHNEQKQHFTKL